MICPFIRYVWVYANKQLGSISGFNISDELTGHHHEIIQNTHITRYEAHSLDGAIQFTTT